MQRDAFPPHPSFNCILFVCLFFVLTIFFLKITSSETGGAGKREWREYNLCLHLLNSYHILIFLYLTFTEVL